MANRLSLRADIACSARDFSRQFVRWGFPARRKKLPSEDEAQLVERIKQLWATNYVQKQMLDVLQSEGWDLDELTLGRLRRKHGVIMRVANGFSTENMGPGTGKKRKRRVADEQPDASTLQAQRGDVDGHGEEPPEPQGSVSAAVPPDEAARRAQRMLELQAYSDSQMEAGKRRRRIRGLAHLPPDAPGLPPRYKSETSLDECKAFLQLSNDSYKAVRQQFEDICIEENIIKKTACEAGTWQEAKNQLVRNNIHLSAMLNPLHQNLEERQNALEVICSDVTKRMRTLRKRILLKDANNILGLNPEQSKELRRQFYEILKADNFQTMLLCGKDHWEELRQQWLDTSPQAQELYSRGLDPEKKRCVDVLLRDAMKRHNDNNVSKIPHMTCYSNASYGPGPGPARRSQGISQPDRPAQASTSSQAPRVERYDTSPSKRFGVQRSSNVDPALYALQAPRTGPMQTNLPTVSPSSQTNNQSLPAYFRLAPESHLVQPHPKLWLATLPQRSIEALRAAAISRLPDSRLRRVVGVVKAGGSKEDHYQIDSEDEFQAFLETIAEMADGKATFIVLLESATT